jgi:creatinine amidohydrolase
MRFAEMTRLELEAARADPILVLVPIAACEKHGDHLPTITDALLVTAVVEGLEARLPDQILLLPTLWLGASSHHLPSVQR